MVLTSLRVTSKDTAKAGAWIHTLQVRETEIGSNHPHSVKKVKTACSQAHQTTPTQSKAFLKVSHLLPTKVHFKTLYTEMHIYTHVLFLPFWAVTYFKAV